MLHIWNHIIISIILYYVFNGKFFFDFILCGLTRVHVCTKDPITLNTHTEKSMSTLKN